ncbi:MAG: GDSL-type esterase/lipase family protein [Bacteroidetes bacterium]|nr:GDSL-type esterase/lipase family protein [Bacteroidota bacterium]
MMISRFVFFAALLLLSSRMTAQDTLIIQESPPPYDSLNKLYPFLNLPANRITGDTGSLVPFFGKLDRIKNGSNEQAVVVHIGDSHVQPGVFTQPLREWMQSAFGDAGHGMMFPYRLAKSNGPAGYITHCDTPWVSGRNATMKRPLPTGISGFTLWSASPAASFTVEFTTPFIAPGDTARLVVFHADRDSCFFLLVSNELNGRSYPVADSSWSYQTTFLIDDQPQKIRIRAMRTKESQTSATFYGMSLESEKPGVIVHTIGVNGAMFSSYTESEHFTGQLAMLHPDLLIFSLGTNEAFGVKAYSSETFRSDIDTLITRIRRTGNKAAVILTTPPGIYKSTRKKRRTSYKPNPVAGTVSEVLKDYASSHGMAAWDWYTIMGGKEGMSKWKAKGLTDRRYIHFSNKGYGIQGVLLREAMIESFGNYKPAVER